jgi:putative ABC transport system permease protein
MITSIALRLYRCIVRAARFDTADLRTAHAEATFASVCDAAARRGRIALTNTVIRELSVVAGVIALGYLRTLLPARWPHLPQPGDSLRSLRIGVRSLLRSHPGYLLMSTFVLAVAVGVNLLVFTIVNALWIRPLPFPDPERVVTITESRWIRLDGPQLQIFEGGIAGQVDTTDTNAGLRPRIEIAGRVPETLGVTSGYFQVLRLPLRGRDFTLEDERDGAEPVAIISDRLWRAVFGRDAEVIGAVVPAQPFSIRIIGIAPPDFTGARRGEQADMWIPTGVVRRLAPADWEGKFLPLMAFGRLGPGQTVQEVDQRFWELTDPRERDFLMALEIRMLRRPRVVSIAGVFGTPDTRTFMVNEHDATLVVAGLATLVLLGGCATMAALVLVHYERRRSELAVKMSLGAGRGRLVRELLRDLSLVALPGTAGGILVAAFGVRVVPRLSLPGGVDIARLDLSIDWRVCAVAVAATLATLVIAATLPIARATRSRLPGELVATSLSTTLASQRIRQALLALQVCATMIILIAAGLFVRAVMHGFGNAPGFDVGQTIFVSIQEGTPYTTGGGYRPDLIVQRNDRLMQALREVPGVQEVATGLPPIGPADRFVIRRLKAQDREHDVSVAQLRGSPELLSALGVPILSGRSLTAADVSVSPYRAVISRSLAERLWPDGNALGQTLRAPVSRYGPFVVVGIARDLPFGSLSDPGDGVVVTAQPVLNGIVSFFVVRTDQPAMVAGSIRRSIKGQVVNVVTGQEVVARDIGRQRLGAWFFSGFGVAALLLGVGGAFGLVAYLAESQRREFGVRLALGASMGHIVRQGLATSLAPVSVGVACGLFVAAAVSRVFTGLLAGISTLDTATYVVVASMMLGCTTVAALTAAWRLRRTSPADALRAT